MDVCSEFLSNPNIDPRTGKRITIGDPIYRSLMLECGIPRAHTRPITPTNNYKKQLNINSSITVPINNLPMTTSIKNSPVKVSTNNSSMIPPINNPSLKVPINKPSIVSPINKPSIVSPINKLSIVSPINNPSLKVPINKASIVSPTNNPSVKVLINKPSMVSPMNNPSVTKTPVRYNQTETPQFIKIYTKQLERFISSLKTLTNTLIILDQKHLLEYEMLKPVDEDVSRDKYKVLMNAEQVAADDNIKNFVRNTTVGKNIQRINQLLRRDWNRLDPNTMTENALSQESQFIGLYKNKNINNIYDANIPIGFDVFEVFTDASFCNLYNLVGSGISNINPIGIASFSLVGFSEANRKDKSVFRTRTYANLVPFYVASSTEAEIYAIYVTLKLYQGKYLIINTDSQAAIQNIAINGIMLLDKNSIAFNTISHCINEIRSMCFERNVVITWVPSHKNVLGIEELNNVADVAADDIFVILLMST